MRSWTAEQARVFLHHVHFGPTSVDEYFSRIGSVQYDPLKPVGRNIDLVFHSRLPDYRVDDWEASVYQSTPRRYYDGWDKQACVLPVSDWPWRRIYHRGHHEHWRHRVFDRYPEAVRRVEAALHERGPSTGDDLCDLSLPGADDRASRARSWYGPRLINHVLKALWHTGRAVTHHRVNGRHVYAAAEDVISDELRNADPIDERENLKWLIRRRVQSVGMLRPNAPGYVWSLPLSAGERKTLINELQEEGRLVPIDVAGAVFHTTTEHLARFEGPPGGGSGPADAGPDRGVSAGVRLIAPLDCMLWDRQALELLYGFTYRWEVYKPAHQRQYGYYVLPIMYGAELVGRMDARCADGVLSILGLWWESPPGDEVLHAYEEALDRFASYLGANELQLPE